MWQYCKVYAIHVYLNAMMSSWCAKWRSQDYGCLQCSAVTLVSWSWETKIVLFGPGLCWQWKTTTSPILVGAISHLSDASQELVIWFMDWIGNSLCYVTTIVLQIKLYFVYVCLNPNLEAQCRNIRSIFNWIGLIFILNFCSLTLLDWNILYKELRSLQLLFLFWFKLCL